MEYSGKRIKPIAIGILAALTIPAPALHANPATLCDGKYAETASLIDAAYAKYGTLYFALVYRIESLYYSEWGFIEMQDC